MRAWLNFSTGVIHVTKNKRKGKKIKEIIQRKPPRKRNKNKNKRERI
jgi:hypothetical protein